MNPLVYVNVTFKNIELKPLFSEECIIILGDIETHVCIQGTAIDLLHMGYNVSLGPNCLLF